MGSSRDVNHALLPLHPMLVRARQEGLDGGHAPAGMALMTGEAVVGLLDAWASSPREVYACSRVIRQRPRRKHGIRQMLSMLTFRFRTPPATETSGSQQAGLLRWGPVSPVHVGLAPGGPQCSLGLLAMGLRGVEGSAARIGQERSQLGSCVSPTSMRPDTSPSPGRG